MTSPADLWPLADLPLTAVRYSTAAVEEVLKGDRYLAPHAYFYVREMRIMAYSQLLESYNSLTLQYMADAFGVSVEFIDKWVLKRRGREVPVRDA